MGHKKQVQFTNKSKTKALQTSAKHWFRNGVHRLAVNLQLHEPDEDESPDCLINQLVNAGAPADFKWTPLLIKNTMRRKAAAMDPPLVLTRASTTLHVTLKIRLTITGKMDRLTTVILRSNFYGKLRWIDNIRVQYGDVGNYKVGFAKCLGFLEMPQTPTTSPFSGTRFAAAFLYNVCLE